MGEKKNIKRLVREGRIMRMKNVMSVWVWVLHEYKRERTRVDGVK